MRQQLRHFRPARRDVFGEHEGWQKQRPENAAPFEAERKTLIGNWGNRKAVLEHQARLFYFPNFQSGDACPKHVPSTSG